MAQTHQIDIELENVNRNALMNRYFYPPILVNQHMAVRLNHRSSQEAHGSSGEAVEMYTSEGEPVGGLVSCIPPQICPFRKSDIKKQDIVGQKLSEVLFTVCHESTNAWKKE